MNAPRSIFSAARQFARDSSFPIAALFSSGNITMTKEKTKRPWDRHDWPTAGDTDINVLYAAVGRCLSQWERYDGTLSLLFNAYSGDGSNQAARRAYAAVRTFEGRVQMLRAASEAYFATRPDSELLAEWKDIHVSACNFAERRNEIAHGTVDHFIPNFQTDDAVLIITEEFCLYPAYANYKARTLGNIPAYAYTTSELDYFYGRFIRLVNPVSSLTGAILRARAKR